MAWASPVDSGWAGRHYLISKLSYSCLLVQHRGRQSGWLFDAIWQAANIFRDHFIAHLDKDAQ
jgi:hypothetical protein